MPARIGTSPAAPVPEGLSPAEFARLFAMPAKEASAYLAGRGRLTETYDWRDMYAEEHAHQFTVSRLARLDLLQSVRDAVVRVTDGDLSRTGFMREVRATLEKSGWWGVKQVTDPATGEIVTTRFTPSRLTLIYDMNTRTAHAAGRWERFERNKSTHPFLRYITKRDERVRASHAEWDGLTLPVNHPFWDTRYPPNGWRCRCRAMAMSQREYDAAQGKDWLKTQAPPDKLHEWTNPRTGDTRQLPEGVDPGFDYNVGKAGMRAKGLDRLVADKLAGYPAPMRAAALAAQVVQPVSETFRSAVDTTLAAIPEHVRIAVAASGYEVRIAPRLLDIDPSLARSTPRGHAPGVTWAHLDGGTLHRKRIIALAETALDPITGATVATSSMRAAEVLRHEFGHAWDIARRLSEDAAFVAAYERDSVALRQWLSRPDVMPAEAIDQLHYLLQPGAAGRQEAFAEIFAALHGGSAASEIDAAKAFPDAAKVVLDMLGKVP